MSDTPSPPAATKPDAYPELGVRHFGHFNRLGLWTLYRKEVQRFMKVWMQTLMAPIITTLLFLAIFSLALAGLRPDINGVPFINFLITPLAFLSGTFYSVTQLPDFAYNVTQYNPFFYMIDGFRYALTGHAEGSLVFGAGFLLVLTVLSSLGCQYVLAKGWRIKS